MTNCQASMKPQSTWAILCEAASFREFNLLWREGWKMSAAPKREKNEIKIFISHRSSTCGECLEDLGSKAWITLVRDKGALCLSCADLDHLIFLPSGDAALTRRARKHSLLSAVVLKWSRARKHYERQGLMVEEAALDLAEGECLADFEVRELRKEREAERRAGLDQK